MSQEIARGIGVVVVVLVAFGCAPKEVVKVEPIPTTAKAPEPAVPSILDGFDGVMVTMGELTRLHREPVGVASKQLMVSLVRAEWTSRERADGSEEKSATAHFVIQRGDEVKNLAIAAGEEGMAFGVSIAVQDAGEEYEASSKRYVQFAAVVFADASTSP